MLAYKLSVEKGPALTASRGRRFVQHPPEADRLREKKKKKTLMNYPSWKQHVLFTIPFDCLGKIYPLLSLTAEFAAFLLSSGQPGLTVHPQCLISSVCCVFIDLCERRI